MNDSLGDRMKQQYENRTRYQLPRRTYTIIRIDGKAFHTFTRGLKRPYDVRFMDCMDRTAVRMCSQVDGVRLAYVQSDEISLLLTDFESTQSQAWFDGNLQKITSVAASLATGLFNEGLRSLDLPRPTAYFDARAFTIPDPVEVANYFIWRQQDAARNAISMAAQAYFSHKQLHAINQDQMQEMLWTEHRVNFNDYPADFKRGRLVRRMEYQVDAGPDVGWAVRHRWEKDHMLPIFTKDTRYLASLIPDMPRLSDDAETKAVVPALSLGGSE